jgi:hypothetical protein
LVNLHDDITLMALSVRGARHDRLHSDGVRPRRFLRTNPIAARVGREVGVQLVKDVQRVLDKSRRIDTVDVEGK